MPAMLRASALFVAAVTAIAVAPTAAADPLDPIPGNGVFVVGSDIAPGLYHTSGSGSAFDRKRKVARNEGTNWRRWP